MIMKNKIIIISILVVSIFIFNCKPKVEIENNELNSFIRINIKDTLSKNIEFGSIDFSYILNDTIKVTDDDDRVLFIYLNIFDKDKKFTEITKIECDTFYNRTKNLKEILNTKFYIKPKANGEKIVAGFVDDVLFLSGYKYKDTNKIRKIINRHYFKEKIYVK